MVLLLIGLIIGILITIVLIIKASKTNPHEVIGINKYCRKCGTDTKGLTCPKCDRNSQSFGV